MARCTATKHERQISRPALIIPPNAAPNTTSRMMPPTLLAAHEFNNSSNSIPKASKATRKMSTFTAAPKTQAVKIDDTIELGIKPKLRINNHVLPVTKMLIRNMLNNKRTGDRLKTIRAPTTDRLNAKNIAQLRWLISRRVAVGRIRAFHTEPATT